MSEAEQKMWFSVEKENAVPNPGGVAILPAVREQSRAAERLTAEPEIRQPEADVAARETDRCFCQASKAVVPPPRLIEEI